MIAIPKNLERPKYAMANQDSGAIVPSGAGRLASVDVLRGLAALGVLFCHIKHHADVYRPNLRYFLEMPLDFGELGVSLFIVISGFCIHLGVAKRMGRGEGIRSDWWGFWRRRVHRLYPPYLAAIAVGLFAYYASRPAAIHPWERITRLHWDVVGHLFMVHNLSPNFWSGVGNFPLWTLGMEEQLYALYFAYLLMRGRMKLAPVLLVVAIVTAGWTLASRSLFPEQLGRGPAAIGEWGKWPLTFWFNWILGAIAAEAYAGAVKLPGWCYRGGLALGAGVLGIGFSDRIMGRIGASNLLIRVVGRGPIQVVLELATTLAPLVIALASFLLLNYWIRAEIEGRFARWWTPWIARVGIFSYSLYLTHIPALHLLESYSGLDDSVGAIALRYLLFTPLCLVLALGFFHAVERHFLTIRPRTAPAPAGILAPGRPT